MTDDEFGLELELDHLEGELSADPHLWDEPRRTVVARAFETASLRPRALALLQGHAPAWIAQAPQVMALRLQRPSWLAYRRLRSIQEVLAEHLFGTSWGKILGWCSGAPSVELPPPAPIPGMDPAWSVSAETLSSLPWQPAVASIVAAFPAISELALRFAAERPRAWRDGGRVVITLRDDRDTPHAWFQLLHELGHAITLALYPDALPRAVDEAVASYLARHLEYPGSLPLPAHAFAPELHRQERLRRAAVAAALGHLEAAIPVEAQEAGEAGKVASSDSRTLPWALWHDAGAQPAYLHAETVADQWWKEGLALAELPRAISEARAQALALPPPFQTIKP